jgi:hypothetical protein
MITGPIWSQKLRVEIAKAVLGNEHVIERLLADLGDVLVPRLIAS